jgi:hypothetical protein
MKTFYLTAVLTATCLLGLGISASAQSLDKVVVAVPFEFVAGGVTLPASEYRITRDNSGTNLALAIDSYNKGKVFLLPITFDGVPSSGQPKLSFEHVAGKYFLSEVDTAGGAYTFGIPRAMVALAQVKDQGTLSSSGTN